MNTSTRIRTNPDGVAQWRTNHAVATQRIRRALSNMADAKYRTAYANLDEACGYLVTLMDLSGQNIDQH